MPTHRAGRAHAALTQTFGLTLRDCRHRLGITQQQLAERANMHRTYLADLERGMRNPALVAITRIAQALDLQLSDFFRRMEQLASAPRQRRAPARKLKPAQARRP